MDDTFAETYFRWGQCDLALNQDADALRQFALACDQDTLRFRADSRINEIIRHSASDHQRDGVQLVDAESLLNAQSSHGAAGEEYSI